VNHQHRAKALAVSVIAVEPIEQRLDLLLRIHRFICPDAPTRLRSQTADFGQIFRSDVFLSNSLLAEEILPVGDTLEGNVAASFGSRLVDSLDVLTKKRPMEITTSNERSRSIVSYDGPRSWGCGSRYRRAISSSPLRLRSGGYGRSCDQDRLTVDGPCPDTGGAALRQVDRLGGLAPIALPEDQAIIGASAP
jgi:hypothetical protein